ncbi:MAG: alpha/beta hydrolase [Gemmatimonadota bacterium]
MTQSLGTTAAAWASARWIDTGGHSVRYREAGSGPTLVLIHGLGVSADYWVRNGPRIAAAGVRVIAPDLPGFGRTDGPEDGLSVIAQADAVRHWANAMELPRAVYLGHSLSCQTVLELAAHHPGMVAGVALAAPTGDGPHRLLRQAIGLARDVRRESVTLSALVVQSYLRAGARRVFRTWSLGAEHDPLQLLPAIQAPGLVLLGSDDPVVDPAFAERIAAGLPNGRLVIIPGAAHAVIFEPTGAFNEAVVEFVKGVE